MPRRKCKEPVQGIGVGMCSLCDSIRVCVGVIAHGGVRWCSECVKQSFGWVQMSEEQRTFLLKAMAAAAEQPLAKKLIEAGEKVPASTRRLFAVGEARHRMLLAEQAALRD